jgi:ribonucleoside-diphosphate reductase alpha chain
MIQVTKRDGQKEPLDIEKLHKVVFHACENITGVSPSEVEIKSQISFANGMTTKEIQETLIKAAADLISEETPNYQYVGGRLINYALRKEVYGNYEPCAIKDLVQKNIDLGFYDPDLISHYNDEEWQRINNFIKHDRDENLTYVAMEQLRGKYLVQNRVSGQIFETPQMCYALIAAVLFQDYPKETRLQWVKEYYDAISFHDISLPTPVMAGVRTPQRQFSSCVLIEADDSLDSINATASSIVKYVSQKAGIGIGGGKIRAIGSPVRQGDAYHTGIIPFYKLFQSAVKSCSQGGVRGGAATVYYPVWHLEVEEMLVLKNNKGTEDNRVRHMDYGVQINKLMYERLINGGNITLFSPNDVPGLYDAFYADQDKFKELYEQAERKTSIRKKSVPAIQLFSSFMEERKNTGRI